MRKTAFVSLLPLLSCDLAADFAKFPITALREIKLLKLLSHENVIRLEDMAVEHPSRPSKNRPATLRMPCDCFDPILILPSR
jgi:hypothetical protein